MQRRGGSGQPVKGERTKGPKARKAPIAQVSTADLQEQLDRRTRERDEALEQLAATSEVLQVISSSPGKLEPVFQAMLENALRICEAKFGTLYLCDGGALRPVADTQRAPPAYKEARKRKPRLPPAPDGPVGRVLVTKQVVHIADLKTLQSYLEHHPTVVDAVELAGFRTALGVPLLRDNELIGVINIMRQEVRPFSDKQIKLVENFAAQAVIAIENSRLLNELRQRTDDLTESLEQQTATSEVLQIISSSPGELEPVFNTMLQNAVQICDARFGNLALFDGRNVRVAAMHNAPPEFEKLRRKDPIVPLDRSLYGTLVRTKKRLHISDMTTEEPYASSALVKVAGARTTLAVPMLKEGELIGAINIYRQEVQPFTDKQVELLENFAAQAVIAIENTRLLNELRETLERQTATSEVLEVISSSRGELEPVFDTMLANATRICEAKFGTLYLRDADGIRAVAATRDAPPAYVEARKRALRIQPSCDGPLGCAGITKQVAHVADIMELQSYRDGHPQIVEAVELGKFRTGLGVPMLKDDELIGVITILRQEVRPFTDKQIELVKNFASQAVIAIENTRLLNELRESLQQQTATADVLKVISRSTFDLKSVLNTLLEAAARLCEADTGSIALPKEKDVYQHEASYSMSAALDAELTRATLKVGKGSLIGRTALNRATVHILDAQKDPDYELHGALKLGDYHTMLGVPLLREGNLVGVLGLARQTIRPFTEKQIELVTTFADQAVIAIENARLFDEVKKRTDELTESLQQQTATADVLKVISRSAFDLRMVLQTLVESAARFCDADKATVIRERNGAFYSAESYGFSQELVDYLKDIPIKAERGTASGRALLEGRVVHIADVKVDPEYTLVEGQRLGDYRTILSVPMLREGVPIGVLNLLRSETRPFADKQIELVTTFADQAAIAIENVRLFESVETRTRELAKSLEDLRTTQDRLVQTQKLASLGQLTAGIAHEIKNPLNFVNNFSGVSVELIDELQQALAGANLDTKLRGEISEIADTLQGNLDKVVQHGKRADAIVKNMLLHSREGSGEHRPVDINTLVEESLNLAYHGARAEKQGFNITMERSLDPAAGQADVFPQDVTRVLLNLISNGFYAATKRRAGADGDGYEPTLVASTRSLGDCVEIRIRDNGTGIPPDVKEKIFNPFFTTKPAGEGTGLGLSICHDIIVKQHGGSIEVDTQPGEFTEIRVILPRVAALLPERP
jgi:two-component system NtrC family sensor kinase